MKSNTAVADSVAISNVKATVEEASWRGVFSISDQDEQEKLEDRKDKNTSGRAAAESRIWSLAIIEYL